MKGRYVRVGTAFLVTLLGVFIWQGLLAAQFETKLTPSDPMANKFFGLPVATVGRIVAVGATFDNEAGTQAGAVYLFSRSNGNWVQETKLIGSDTAPEDQFGFSVAISNDTIVVGVPLHDGAAINAGALYVFRREESAWAQQAKLIADDATVNTGLGSSVAINGATIAVGASRSEAVYTFQEREAGWIQTAKLKASDGVSGDRFGTSVGLSGNSLLVGAPEHNSQAGAVYVFERRGAWAEKQKLVAPDSTPGDFFGRAVSLSGGTAIIGAPFNNAVAADSGAAYLFSRRSASWQQEAKLTASDGAASDFFGFTVSLSGNTAVVGAPFDDDAGSSSGSVYVFQRGATWAETQKLSASDAAGGDQFGRSVSINGPTLVVGAHLDDDEGAGAGAAYVYKLH